MNKPKIKKLFIGLLPALIFLTSVLKAQAQELSVLNYTVEDGLPSNEVYDVFEDKKGYLWFCTDRGVARYDGYTFKRYNSFNSDLPSNTVFKCFEDSWNTDELWFTTMNGAIAIYNMAADSFRNFKYSDFLDSAWNLWPERLEFTENKVIIIPKTSNLNETVISYDRTDDNLYLHPLHEFYDRKTPFFTGAFIPHRNWRRRLYGSSILPNALASTPDAGSGASGSYLVPCNTARTKGGITYFAVYDTLFAYSEQSLNAVLATKERIHEVRLGKHNEVVALTNAGFYRETSTGWVRHLPSDQISNMHIDREGNEWFTTLNRGVIKLPANRFLSHQKKFGFDEGQKLQLLSSFKDWLIVTTDHNDIYALSRNGAVQRLIPDTGETKFFVRDLKIIAMTYQNDTGYLSGNWILVERNGSPEVISYGRNQSFDLIYPITRDTVFSSYQGYGYILTPRKNHKELSGKAIAESYVSNSGINKKVRALIDKGSYVLLGSQDGLWRINKDQLQVAHRVLSKKLTSRVNELVELADGRVLAATFGQGLAIIDQNEIKFITSLDGLPSDLVNSVVAQNDSVFWVGSNGGLSLIQINNINSDASIINFDVSEGLVKLGISKVHIWNDHLWLLSGADVLSLDLARNEFRSVQPVIHITGLSQGSNLVTGVNSFKHDQNDLKFEFLAISHNKPIDSVYRFRLLNSGDSSSWSYSSTREVNLLNLSPGKYTFEVLARNNDNKWSAPATYSFVITPHFSQTVWFRILGSLLIGFIFFLIITVRQRRRNRERERETKITELELNSLRNQMNPHFVFNSLNSLQNLILENEHMTSLDFISRFSKLMRSSLSFSKKEFISIEDELEFLEQYLQTEQLRFPERFSFELNCDESLINEQVQIPPLLLQPLFENAVKHAFSPKQKNGKISLSMTDEDGVIRIILEDNGVGIESSKVNVRSSTHESKGIAIVKERLRIMQDKNPNSIFSINMEDLSKRQNGVTGTRIEIKMPILD